MHSYEQISAFVAVYDHGSYSGAAQTKQKSRATIREHIQAYEDLLGYPLFIIEGKKATPTANARHLIKRARILLKQHESLYTHGLNLFSQPQATIVLCFDTLTPSALMAAIDHYVRNHFPHLQLNWLQRNREQALSGLLAGEIDIALLPALGNVFANKHVTWRSLGNVSLSLVTRQDSPLARLEQLTIEDLLADTHLVTEAQIDLDQHLTGFNIAPNASVISNNDLLLELLSQHGWAMLPKFLRARWQSYRLTELHIDEISSKFNITLNTFFLHGKAQEAPYHAILTFAQHYFSQQNDW